VATEQFIEVWDCDLLTLPTNLPPWYERQQALLDDEVLRWRAAERSSGRLSHEHVPLAAAQSYESLAAASEHADAAEGAPVAESPFAGDVGDAGSPDAEPAAAEGVAPMRVSGPLVLPGTSFSTIDRDD
jgi:hypothetical protein